MGGTWGAQFHPELRVIDGADILKKGTAGEDGYSVFTVRDPETGDDQPTALERILRERGIERVVIVGLATDYCVKETALDARRLGFRTLVVADATRAVELQPGDGDRAIEAMRDAGAEIA